VFIGEFSTMKQAKYSAMNDISNQYQKGVTLIEMMVSMVISLLLILAASSVYIAGKEGFKTNDDRSRNLESGRLAIDILARNIRMAGSYNFDASNPQTNTVFQTGGFRPIFADQVAGRDRLSVAYDSIQTYNAGKLEGTDCEGQPIGVGMVRNRFSVSADGQLMCEGTGSTTPIPIVTSVADWQIRFAQITNPTEEGQPDPANPTIQVVDVGGVTSWEDVRTVHICLDVISFEDKTLVGATPGLNCRGVAFPSDNRVHKIYRSVVNIRNQTRGGNFIDPVKGVAVP
jgi:type IV pilus assembly protein PilW